MTLAGRRVLLIVAGGIAAYKSLELVRLLRREGCAVACLLTEGGARFVTALSLQALSEQPVHTDLWSLTDESAMGHIALSRAAELIVVAPASADLLARMAAGFADNLATTVLLATDAPVLVAPAMNVRMWQHPATRASMAVLAQRGVAVVGPDEGAMACHEYGPGRLAEPAVILAAITARLTGGTLAGLHAIVTSGPTHEPIDPVRYLANRSSGRQGHAIAAALAARGARVSLVHGPVAIADPPGVTAIAVETAVQMRDACLAALPADCFVAVAAVGDWRLDAPLLQKVKKSLGPPTLKLTPNPDILAEIAGLTAGRPRLVVGFAAETENLAEAAELKRARKGCDWLLGNDVSVRAGIIGGLENEIVFASDHSTEHWPRMTKIEVADRLARAIVERFAAVPS